MQSSSIPKTNDTNFTLGSMAEADLNCAIVSSPVVPSADDEHAHKLVRALRSRPTANPIIVDFDEMIWLRDSTEEYLGALRPQFLGLIIIKLIDALWSRWFSQNARANHVYRDWLRVLITSILLPWNVLLWKSRARMLGELWKNADLIHILKSETDTPPYIITFGFSSIVRPLLREIYPSAQLLADSMWTGYRMRRVGKKAWLERILGARTLGNAMVITDSEDGADVIGACRDGFIIKWPCDDYGTAFARNKDEIDITDILPDWSREQPNRFWDPSRKLLRTIRRYQEFSLRRSLFGLAMAKVAVVEYRFWSIVTGADIPLNCNIGGGLLLPHPNGIVIHPCALIGINCVIFQQVTIGDADDAKSPPIIEGHVYIGAGAKVLGPIRIGAHAKIGANAVVLTDVPPGATAVGVPARISKTIAHQAEPQHGF